MRPPIALSLPLAGLAAVLLAGCGGSSSAPPQEESKPKELAVGDPCPPLKVAYWLNGPPVEKLEPGKVYVLDFWATWCGPCIEAMPHLAELQAKYKDQGLVVIPITSLEAKRNTRKEVDEFVAANGPRLGLSFAVCDTAETDTEVRLAAGLRTIPATFVVGRDGTVQYFGYPEQLDEVLPKVLAGTWAGKADADRLKKRGDELDDVGQRIDKDSDAALRDLAALEARYPELADDLHFQEYRVRLHLIAGRFDDARAATEKLLPRLAAARKAGELHQLVGDWTDPDVNPKRRHVDLAVRAAETLLGVTGTADSKSLAAAAWAYDKAGDKRKAVEFARKAVEHAPDKQEREQREAQLKQYEQ